MKTSDNLEPLKFCSKMSMYSWYISHAFLFVLFLIHAAHFTDWYVFPWIKFYLMNNAVPENQTHKMRLT